MKLLKVKIVCFILFGFVGFTNISQAQEGSVIINQDPEIVRLLKLKKEINTNENTSNRYKIQIYSGRRSSAESAQSSFRKTYGEWSTKLVYETPNYKIWVGSFRSRLEADRALLKIKRKFANAFIFRPKKEKN